MAHRGVGFVVDHLQGAPVGSDDGLDRGGVRIHVGGVDRHASPPAHHRGPSTWPPSVGHHRGRDLLSGSLVRAHTQLGDTLLPWVIGLLLIAVAILARQLISQRRPRRFAAPDGLGMATATRSPRDALGGRVVTAVLAALAIVVAGGAIIDTYRIGDSGSRAAWTGNFSPQQL